MNKFKKIMSNKLFIKILSIIIVICVVLAGIRLFLYESKASLSSDKLEATLSKASDLTTAKLNYTGVANYSDTGIPILTKGDFVMIYDATVWAGIDLAAVKPEVDNNSGIVWVTIPKATIQEVKVDPSSIRYFDEKFTLINCNEKEDANNAQAEAEKDAVEEANKMGILELANQQAETLVKGILESSIPKDYQIKVRDNNAKK